MSTEIIINNSNGGLNYPASPLTRMFCSPDHDAFSNWLSGANPAQFQIYCDRIAYLEKRINLLMVSNPSLVASDSCSGAFNSLLLGNLNSNGGSANSSPAGSPKFGRRTSLPSSAPINATSYQDEFAAGLTSRFPLEVRLRILENLIPDPSADEHPKACESLWPRFKCKSCILPEGFCHCKEFYEERIKPWVPLYNYFIAYPHEKQILLIRPFKTAIVWRNLMKVAAWKSEESFLRWLIEQAFLEEKEDQGNKYSTLLLLTGMNERIVKMSDWTRDVEIVAIVCLTGHFSMVQYLVGKRGLPFDATALAFSAFRGHVKILKYLLAKFTESPRYLCGARKSTLYQYITRFASLGGQCQLLKKRDLLCMGNIEYAALGGHLRLVKRMMELTLSTRHSYNLAMFDVRPVILKAVSSGSLPLVKYLMTKSWYHHDFKYTQNITTNDENSIPTVSNQASNQETNFSVLNCSHFINEALKISRNESVSIWLKSQIK